MFGDPEQLERLDDWLDEVVRRRLRVRLGSRHDGGRDRGAAARRRQAAGAGPHPDRLLPRARRVDTAAFDGFVAELARQFPLLHERLELTRVHTHGLLFHWRGASAERPVALMAHLDVVPVEGDWQHDAFSGEVVDGQIWGRGTLDDKGCLVGICEAVETLLERDFTPAQDVWLSFGCDEEVFGTAASQPSPRCRRRGVRPWFVVDEGGAIAHDAFTGVGKPIGVVGVTEKGIMSVQLRVEGRGGHASTPARMGPTARLARAITRLDRSPDADQPAAADRRAVPPARPARAAAAAPADGERRPARPRAGEGADRRSARRAPPWCVRRSRSPRCSGSPALNVIAGTATAGVNIRIMLGDTVRDGARPRPQGDQATTGSRSTSSRSTSPARSRRTRPPSSRTTRSS